LLYVCESVTKPSLDIIWTSRYNSDTNNYKRWSICHCR